MPSDLISIVVPVFNIDKYLSRCIESIIAQTYKNLEIILVDDGSYDNCPQICDEYVKKDSRIKVIHKENGGLSSARNAGIDIADGNYIGFIDGDDYILPEMYQKLYNSLIAADSDLSICGYKFVDEQENIIDWKIQSPIKDEIFTTNQAYEKIVGAGYFYFVTSVNKLYKKAIFSDIRFPIGKLHEDEFTVHHIFSKCKRINSISEALYLYVQHSESIMNKTFSVERLDGAWAFYDRYLFLKEKGLINFATKALVGSYGVTVRGIRELNVLAYEHDFSIIFRKIFPALFIHKPGRGIFLLVIYILKFFWMKLSFSRFKFTFSASYWRAKFEKKKIVFLVATPEHGNLGDHAIVFAERLFFKNAGYEIIEIRNNDYLRWRSWIHDNVSTKDILVIDGGGNLGTLWPEEDDKISDIISRFPNNEIVVFPQTCYYDYSAEGKFRLARNKKIYANSKKLTILLRDRASYEFAIQNFKNVRFIYSPDIVLYLTDFPSSDNREGVLMCFRKDKEKVLDEDIIKSIETKLLKAGIPYSDTSTVINRSVNYLNRKRELRKKWNEFACSKLVITDRLHAMIFAAITGTPCIAVDNKSKKVGGTYEWIKDLKYIHYLNSTEDIFDHIEKLYSYGNGKYVLIYPSDIYMLLGNKKVDTDKRGY